MAKKNSSKTATQEAISNSTPRIITLSKFQGINISGATLDAESRNLEQNKNDWLGKGQTDAQSNFLALQNNLICSENGSIESRYESRKLAPNPPNSNLTGVAITHEEYIYAAANTNGNDTLWRFKISSKEINESDWQEIKLHNLKTTNDIKDFTITCIDVFAKTLVVLGQVPGRDDEKQSNGEMFLGKIKDFKDDDPSTRYVENQPHINDPLAIEDEPPEDNKDFINISSVGDIHSLSSGVSKLKFIYTVTNAYGSTFQSDFTRNKVLSNGEWIQSSFVLTNRALSTFDSNHYLTLSGNVAASIPSLPPEYAKDFYETIGVDIYVSVNESDQYIFIGHSAVDNTYSWNFNWLGALMDTTQLSMSSISVPTMNTTDGVDATHMDQYDGRMYFYGGSEKDQLYIGGNPGSEFSISTGLGGAFVPIEQGSGQEIKKVLKFKTYNGATTITVLTHHANTNRSSRYNLVENNLSITNEYSKKGYYAEKVDSVSGTSSFYGADTFQDGLYAVSRYGLYSTTKAMENQNNIKMAYVSDAIEPIFKSFLGKEISKAKMLCIGKIIYLLIRPDNSSIGPDQLDDCLFCYDTELKAWYTLSLFPTKTSNPYVQHIFNVDSIEHYEGIGVVCSNTPNINNGGIWLLPTTGDTWAQYYNKETKEPIENYPSYTNYLESHELALRTPITNLFYACQIEIRFDYFCSPEGVDIWTEGYDYYGRHFKVIKNVKSNKLQRQTVVYLRLDRYVESFKLFIKGKAHFRLTHINLKVFQMSPSIGIHYGHDTLHIQKKQHNKENNMHHEIKDYNNLKEIIMT